MERYKSAALKAEYESTSRLEWVSRRPWYQIYDVWGDVWPVDPALDRSVLEDGRTHHHRVVAHVRAVAQPHLYDAPTNALVVTVDKTMAKIVVVTVDKTYGSLAYVTCLGFKPYHKYVKGIRVY